ncbi:hypothetical protein [Umezawaea sp.]|uniref:hypothetical protein n=1 Tax=Umezawaea sp. TaxID=1955258 RepID=UPI002ED662E0
MTPLPRTPATLALVLGLAVVAAPVPASASPAPAVATVRADRPAAPPPPPMADGSPTAQACVLGVWDGPSYTGRGVCFQVTQVPNWAGYTYPDGSPVNNTASSTFNYGSWRIRLCANRDFVNCMSALVQPGSGFTTLPSGFDNAVSSHFNASV